VNYSNPLLLAARRFAQDLHILKPIQRAGRRLFPLTYEARFDSALESAIQKGDVVWDVGANVGFYTQRFAKLVGDHGLVVAFEPAPGAANKLRQDFSQHPNVVIREVALSNVVGTSTFTVTGASASTNSLSSAPSDGGSCIEVPVSTGDNEVAHQTATTPSILKIDVEGYELEVLKGMTLTLGQDVLRAVFIEVHFAILNGRGQRDAPRDIVSILSKSGFHTTWVDSSHIAAYRR
jgi:FkbM family methyltransferase